MEVEENEGKRKFSGFAMGPHDPECTQTIEKPPFQIELVLSKLTMHFYNMIETVSDVY